VANLLTDNAKNAMLDALAGVAAYGSLHTADPGTTGTNEVTGGSPAYARKALSWASASGGSVALQATFPVFDVPATTVAYVGMFSASSGGTYYGHWDVTDEVFAGQGTYTVTSGSVSLT
jgi:hypothetical protein